MRVSDFHIPGESDWNPGHGKAAFSDRLSAGFQSLRRTVTMLLKDLQMLAWLLTAQAIVNRETRRRRGDARREQKQ